MNTGDTLPDFTLIDHNKKEWSKKLLEGKMALFSWHPLAWTKVCAQQMQSLEEHANDFEKMGVVALGLSVDTVPSKHAWAKKLGIEKTPLLSDFWPHGHFASLLGIFRKNDGFSERANIIVDKKRIMRFIKIYPISELPDIAEIIGELGKWM
ncbi:MAG: redoxin domain-containing protein [Caldisericales bacterium]|nr:redoxin domain-containing protein [bacterium]